MGRGGVESSVVDEDFGLGLRVQAYAAGPTFHQGLGFERFGVQGLGLRVQGLGMTASCVFELSFCRCHRHATVLAYVFWSIGATPAYLETLNFGLGGLRIEGSLGIPYSFPDTYEPPKAQQGKSN